MTSLAIAPHAAPVHDPVDAVVMGLGYVDVPLAVALFRSLTVTGFDVDAGSIAELCEGHDRSGEIDSDWLADSLLRYIGKMPACPLAELYIVTAPTPFGDAEQPDLSIVRAASRSVGAMLPCAFAAGFAPVVISESTVCPSGISIWNVLDAARTKSNFLPSTPGLVGGRCIGDDPYYLAHYARTFDHLPRMILAGRDANGHMARQVANLVRRLEWLGHTVDVHDHRADRAEALHEYGIDQMPELPERTYDLVLPVVPQREYLAMMPVLRALAGETDILVDLRGQLGDAAGWTL